MARTTLIHMWFGTIALLASVSLLGTLFWRPLWLLGAAAFLMVFVSFFVANRVGRQPFLVRESIVAPFMIVFFVLFLTTVLLSGRRGAPSLGNLPVFAARPRYAFTRAPSVERWRFVIVAAAFQVGWHSFLGLFLANQWLAWLATRAQATRSDVLRRR